MSTVRVYRPTQGLFALQRPYKQTQHPHSAYLVLDYHLMRELTFETSGKEETVTFQNNSQVLL